LIEFKLTTLAGFVLIPFALFNKTAFLAEKVLGNVVASGIKVMVLAVIIGIGSGLFSQFTNGYGGSQPTIEQALSVVLAALSLLGLGIFGPGIATGLVSGAPQLGAGAAVGTGLVAAGLGAGAVMGVGAAVSGGGALLAGAGRMTAAAARGGAAMIGATSSSYGLASATRGAAAAANTSAANDAGPPAWAQRMNRSQTMHHGVSAAVQTVRSSDSHGGGHSVDLSQQDS
jgi:type IV secretion system protein TrbL